MTEPNRQSGENEERIIEIEIERLRPFKEHPFQVKDDKEMFILQESIEKYHDDMRQVDEIVNLIVETVMCKNDKILIASNWYPASLVKKKFLMLTYSHIEYVLHCMRGNTTKVKNIKKYLLAALFNAPSTMNGYYQAEVNHDVPGLVR